MTDLIEVKTADLVGEALGWAVGKAEGLNLELVQPQYGNPWRVFARYQGQAIEHTKRYNPWENWALGGPLIDRLQVEILRSGPVVHAKLYGLTNAAGAGDSALIAACRAIVAAKLGDTVQVPKELIGKEAPDD